MKKVLSYVICLAVLISMAMPCVIASADEISVWDGNPVASGMYSWLTSDLKSTIQAGSGTIHITSASQLAILAFAAGKKTYVDYTEGQLDFEGITIVLDTDIDLNNKPWSPICSNDAYHPFKGTFDGQGHTIYNMYSPSTGSSDMYASNRNPNGKKFFGLFGYMAGTVKNVKVKNAEWEFDSANGSSTPAGGAIAAFLGSYQDVTMANGNKNDFKALIDNCSAENVTFRINSTKNFDATSSNGGFNSSAMHGFAGIAGTVYNGSVTNSYVRNVNVDASSSTYVPSKCAGLLNILGLKHKDGYVANAFEISHNFVIGKTITTSEGTNAITFMYNPLSRYYVRNGNVSDGEHMEGDDDLTFVTDEEGLKSNTVWTGSAYYYDSENALVKLKSETGITSFALEYDDVDEEFMASANLAKVDDGTAVIVALYDITGANKKLSDIKITRYNKETGFNSIISASLPFGEFDSETTEVKAFIVNPASAKPYAELEYTE